MVTASKDIITKERFDSGFTYHDYRAQMPTHGNLYDENYADNRVTDQDVKDFHEIMARPGGPAKVLIITENWCPDCYREVPVMARIAEATGLDLRILERDKNPDAIQPFRKLDEFESIPVFVFYDKDMNYITHYIERSYYAETQIPLSRVGYDTLTQEERQKRSAEYRAAHWTDWRRATIDEVKEMLDKKLAPWSARLPQPA